MRDTKTVVIIFDRQHMDVIGIFDKEDDADEAVLLGSTAANVLVVTFEEDEKNKGCYINNPKVNFLPYLEMDAVG